MTVLSCVSGAQRTGKGKNDAEKKIQSISVTRACAFRVVMAEGTGAGRMAVGGFCAHKEVVLGKKSVEE